VIVICPNCGTRYKMPDTMSLAGKRMRCAECEHRWVLPDAAEEEDALAEAQNALQNDMRSEEPAPPYGQDVSVGILTDTTAEPIPETESEAPEEQHEALETEDAPPARNWLLWGLIVVGAAFALLALAISSERLDPSRVPVIGSLLTRLQPSPSSLTLSLEARITPMASGLLLLDVRGEITNTSRKPRTLPPFKASLASPQGVVRRWAIAPPAAQLAPGAKISFATTLTDVPAGARSVRVIGS